LSKQTKPCNYMYLWNNSF